MNNYLQLNTPCFVIKTNQIDELMIDLKDSVQSHWQNAIIGYSFKTNNLPWIITYMKKKGLYAEVVSSSEYHLAVELGYMPDKIIFNGPVKGKDEFITAVENKSIVNIDSNRELQWLLECDETKLKTSNLGLRVNFCLEDYCPGESQGGQEDGRFGFSYENGDLFKAISFFKEHDIPLSGLHLHCSSKTRSLNIYNAIATIAVRIVEEYNLNLKYIDVGGGFFGGVPGKPAFSDYFNGISTIFKTTDKLENINIIVEPGMCLIGASMDYVSTVVDVKQTKNNEFVVLDGSRIHIDPLMRKTGYSYHVNRKNNQIKTNINSQILCGFTCMENDRFFKIDHLNLAINDQIVFEKVGAYTIGLAPQFIEFHPFIYAQMNDEISLVQDRRTAKEFIK